MCFLCFSCIVCRREGQAEANKKLTLGGQQSRRAEEKPRTLVVIIIIIIIIHAA